MDTLSTPVLEVRNLAISFKDKDIWRKAVENVSFVLNRGETIGIVGESGSGKSVSALSVLRLLPDKISRIDTGEILFHSNDRNHKIFDLNYNDLRKIRGNKISMIFQEPMTSLNPVMKCGKQVIETIKLHLNLSTDDAKLRTLKLFEDVMLNNPEYVYNAYPHQLSGGQKQRVMIAMAIACSPEVLIADEPTTALDVTVQKSILNLLKQLQQKLNLSLIFISHDLGVVSEICDKVIVMQKGCIVEQGASKELFFNPSHPYTKGLMACRPSLNVRLKTLPTVKDFITEGATFENQIETAEERKARHSSLYHKEPILKVKDLSVRYTLPKPWYKKENSYFYAVNNVSFDVYKGETLGLVGESGCGKTTLGRSILRLIEPSDGNILFEGKDVSTLNKASMRELRKKMQIIFQDPYSSLNPRITIGESIIEPLKAHRIYKNDRERKNKVLELLERVNLLPEFYNRYPHQFSGGQRQRICIARALVLNPSFVICDESVSALDVSVQAQVLNLLNDLKKDFGFTYIFISHDLSVVKYMSDRMLVMKSGKIIEQGEADEVYRSSTEPYTRQLIDSIPGKAIKPLITP